MANGTGYGPCFMESVFRRRRKRAVLCDIGYTVSTIYSSTTAAIEGTVTAHGYTGGTCTPVTIYGINDGLVKWRVYLYDNIYFN